MKKGDIGMANRLSKKYTNKGWAFNYLQIKDAYQHLMLHHYQHLMLHPYTYILNSGNYPSIVYSWGGCG